MALTAAQNRQLRSVSSRSGKVVSSRANAPPTTAVMQRLGASLPRFLGLNLKHARSNSLICHAVQTRPFASSTEQLVQQWNTLLDNVTKSGKTDPKAKKFDAGEARQLLREALRVYSQQLSGAVLPDQFTGVFIRYYREMLAPEDRAAFFRLLCTELGLQASEVNSAIRNWQSYVKKADGKETHEAEMFARIADKLNQATRPAYAQLFLPISQHKEGIKFLTDMRADLLDAILTNPASAGPLRALSEELSFVVVQEKVMLYEAVHEIRDWDDLKQRLGQGRRVFCFFHPSMPEEPLVILHAAVMDAPASSMDSILTQSREDAVGCEERGKVAVFYSISATQRGLAGIDLGNFLIKRVALLLQKEFPNLQQMVTLSPMPNFRSWLMLRLAQQPQPGLLNNSEERDLLKAGDMLRNQGCNHHGSAANVLSFLMHEDRWVKLPEHEALVKRVLMRLAAHFLANERRRHLALDPVAHFHLKNGASIWRLNWKADMSERGLRRSCGMMVNYQYVLEDLLANNRSYLMDHNIMMSPLFRQTLHL